MWRAEYDKNNHFREVKKMKIEKINQVFEILEDFCSEYAGCECCPFSNENYECKFKVATGEIPPTFCAFTEE